MAGNTGCIDKNMLVNAGIIHKDMLKALHHL